MVTLLDRSDRFVFKPMLYELVNETMNDWEVAPTFTELLAPTSIQFRRGSVATVEPDDALPMRDGSVGSSGGGVVILDDGERVEYDYLVVAVGTGTSDASVPGAKEHAIPLSTLEDAKRLAAAMRHVSSTYSSGRGRVAVVGGGLAGVELAGVVAERLGDGATVELLASTSGIMPGSPAGQREAAARSLAAAGVVVREGVRATRVGPSIAATEAEDAAGMGTSSSAATSASTSTSVSFTEGVGGAEEKRVEEKTEEYDVVCWAVGQRVESPEAWPFPTDERTKKILTDSTLRVSGHARVFALGDVSSATAEAAAAAAAEAAAAESSAVSARAAPPPAPALPSTAQVAFQQADYAAWNIWASVEQRPLLPFKYQHLGDMMVLGKVDAAVALPVGDATIDGPLAALLRRAAYLYRMPTNEHRAKLATNWLQQGAQFAVDEGPGILKKLGVPVPDFIFPNRQREP